MTTTFSNFLNTHARASRKTARGSIIRILRQQKPINAAKGTSAYVAMKRRLNGAVLDPAVLESFDPVIESLAQQFDGWRQVA